jgi:hypothetical protein
MPAPGKLKALQEWQVPRTVSELRGFLGLANYYACYVPDFAEFAAPLQEHLKVDRVTGKKGSKAPVKFTEADLRAFQRIKEALCENLEVFQLDPDSPFVLRCDASDVAIGAVLEQERGDKWVPVGFLSRKLTPSQKNWSAREKECYAIVAALHKWAGWIGFQPVTVTTDHKTLESWVKEYVETHSGPSGRRARWLESMSNSTCRWCMSKGRKTSSRMR